MSGHVVFDGTTLKPPASLGRIRASLSAVTQGRTAAVGVAPVMVNASGTFSFIGVAPGRYQMSAGAIEGWQPLSAVVGGRNSFDAPFEVRSEDITDAVLTFTDHPSELSGSIQDAAGHPAPDYFVVVFPADKSLWTPQSRRIQAKRPASDGHFVWPNLPPGEYLLAAVTDVEQGQWYDPAFLATLAPAAVRLTIAPGQKAVQHLKIAK